MPNIDSFSSCPYATITRTKQENGFYSHAQARILNGPDNQLEESSGLNFNLVPFPPNQLLRNHSCRIGGSAYPHVGHWRLSMKASRHVQDVFVLISSCPASASFRPSNQCPTNSTRSSCTFSTQRVSHIKIDAFQWLEYSIVNVLTRSIPPMIVPNPLVQITGLEAERPQLMQWASSAAPSPPVRVLFTWDTL